MNTTELIPVTGIVPELRDNGNPQPGAICLANEARFTASHFSEPLTAYATGWRDPNRIEETLDFVAPPVQTARRFEWKKSVNAEEYYSETDDERAIGAEFKRVEYRGLSVNDKTINKGLTLRVDLDEAGEMANWRELAVGRLLRRLLRNELRRAVTALSTAATNVAKTWDASAGKDPDNDVLGELITASTSSGIRPNRVLYGDTAWSRRVLAHRAQNSAGGFGSAGLTPDQLAGFLGVDGVRVSRERWQSSAAAKTELVNNLVLMYFALADLSPEDASNIKRFWSPVTGGGKYRVYEQAPGGKYVDITVEHYSNLIVTSSTGIRKITVS